MIKFSTKLLKLGLLCGVFFPTGHLHGQMQATPVDVPMAESKSTQTVGFDRVQPILRKRCQTCHNPEELRGDLSVTDMTALAAGSSSGPVLVAGKPRESLLYTTAAHLDEPTMPPNSRKIPARELEVIRRWIEDGLVPKSGDQPQAAEAPSEEALSATEPAKASNADGNFEPVHGLLQSAAISSLAAQPGGNLVALSGNRQIVLLDSESAEFVNAIPFPQQEITKLAFSSDGQLLVAGGGIPGLSGSIFGFDIARGSLNFQLADENDSILGLDLSPDGRLVAFGGPSKTLKICRVADGENLHTLRKHTDWVLSVKFSDDGLLVASSDRFGGLFVWEAATGELFHALQGHTGPVHDIAWDADGETLLSAGEDGQIRVWNLHHGELTAQWEAGVGAILSLDRKGALTLVGGRNGLVKAWSTPDVCVATYDAKEQVDRVVIAGQAELGVAADASGRLHLLKIPSLEATQVVTLPTRAEALPELVARLEGTSAAYDQEMEELRKLASQKQEQQAMQLAQSAAAKEANETVDALQQATQPSSTSQALSSNSALVAAIEAEVNAVQRTLAEQITTRDRIARHLADLQADLEAQTRLVESSKLQLERLEKILQLAQQPMSSHGVSGQD